MAGAYRKPSPIVVAKGTVHHRQLEDADHTSVTR
jgi:hypothetical protein